MLIKSLNVEYTILFQLYFNWFVNDTISHQIFILIVYHYKNNHLDDVLFYLGFHGLSNRIILM